jgi:Major Facilitator Superfamily
MLPSRRYEEVPSRDDDADGNAADLNDIDQSEEDKRASTTLTASVAVATTFTSENTVKPTPLKTGPVLGNRSDTFQDEIVDFYTSPTNSITNEDASSEEATMTVDEAIERIGMGYFQLVVLTAAGLCFAADAMQVLLLSFLSEVLRLEWNLTNDETAFITSILFIGAIFGTLTLGPLADKKGRKPVFLLAATIISCFGMAVAMVTDYFSLLASLFMVGWGVGGLTGKCMGDFAKINRRYASIKLICSFFFVQCLLTSFPNFYQRIRGERTCW